MPSSDTAHDLLASVRDLTRQVRAAQRGTWYPLLLLAVITLIGIPVLRYGGHHMDACTAGAVPGMRLCRGYSLWGLVYWSVALVLAYALTAAYYLRRSRRLGVGTRIRPYVVVGVVVTAAVAALTVWSAHQMPPADPTLSPAMRVLALSHSPEAAVGVGLLVLAWVERNPVLAGLGAVYLAIVLTPIGQYAVGHPSPWFFAPHMFVTAGILLLGSLYFATAGSRAGRGAR
jgi:hypothetical protein